MAFSCPNCGGNVLFDIETQRLKCQHCDSSFSNNSFQVRSRSKASTVSAPELQVFLCPDCGAQLRGTEDSMVGMCPYCGGQSMLVSDRTEIEEPEKILPFRITRKKCAELFQQRTAGVRYLARELRDPAFLESFTGIYVPFFSYEYQLKPSFARYQTTVTNAGKEWRHTVRVEVNAEDPYRSPPYDASRYLDDVITRRVMPYNLDRLRQYQPSYLSGFYADCSTVPPKTYRDDSRMAAQSQIKDEADKKRGHMDFDAGELQVKPLGCHRLLLPMWFLTWRRGKRAAYAVVNGETGKLSVDLPIDYRRFALCCLGTALLLFLLLELLVQPTPTIAAGLSLLVSIVMSRSVRNSTQALHARQTHRYDKGWSGEGETLKPPTSSRKRTRTCLLVIAAVFLLMPFSGRLAWFPMKIACFALFSLVLDSLDVLHLLPGLSDIRPFLAQLFVFLSVLGIFLVFLIFPVADVWYYLGVAGGILLLTLASLLMLQVYNASATHPLPKLFDREEVPSR